MVGRSNVGKSSLINALVRQQVARTSAAPGKTRLANIYRVNRGTTGPFYLVDLPGYGYARGGTGATREFQELTRAYFDRGIRLRAEWKRQSHEVRLKPDATDERTAALLLVDARHPGLQKDIEAWHWLQAIVDEA